MASYKRAGRCSPLVSQKQKPEVCGRSTAVVRLLAKEKVVGSNPIARSDFSVNGWQLGSWRAIGCQPICCITWRRRQVARQGSAKPSSWVQIPSSPQSRKRPAKAGLFLINAFQDDIADQKSSFHTHLELTFAKQRFFRNSH